MFYEASIQIHIKAHYMQFQKRNHMDHMTFIKKHHQTHHQTQFTSIHHPNFMFETSDVLILRRCESIWQWPTNRLGKFQEVTNPLGSSRGDEAKATDGNDDLTWALFLLRKMEA